MKILLKNEKGATSVLVIFMMIVLVSLGAFSITAANVNYKFSKEVLKFNMVYYDLETKAEIFIMEVDNELEKSESEAIEYIEGKKYELDSVSGVPDDLQQVLKKTYENTDEKKSISDILNKIYLYYSRKNLLVVKERYQDSNISDSHENINIEKITAEINVKSELNVHANLKVKLRVVPLSYDIFVYDSKVNTVKKDKSSRYKIEEYNEWQIPVEYNNALELWEGLAQ